MKILSIESYEYLLKNIVDLSNKTASSAHSDVKLEKIQSVRKIFPDSEHYLKIENSDDIFGKPVILLGGIIDPHSLFELYNIANGLVDFGCSSLTLIIPYVSYSTMELANETGEVLAIKSIARLLSSMPHQYSANRIYLFDIHSDKILKYFTDEAQVEVISSESMVMQIIKSMITENDRPVIASVDMGRADFVGHIAKSLGLEKIFITKERISPTKTKVVSMSETDIFGKTIIIYDDMVRTGSSLINAANCYSAAGASKVIAIISHGIFLENALEKIKNCGAISQIFCMNTHPNVNSLCCCCDNFLKICDVSEIILNKLFPKAPTPKEETPEEEESWMSNSASYELSSQKSKL